ncbi:MFS transporter [Paenibacillus brasilensis]|uniref:Tetracycline resistance protein n=1 Tax=Paenibacillus brasilensis TaxID=128574 RepID=A0ABU0L756_9BACL|nr:MFS transporter [Paenibacillus brasilensis]MDQ0497129.1 DHA2 family metal-tetracycline-proton antiporter-like MFS transporter [Paenibacillus brasilensis]
MEKSVEERISKSLIWLCVLAFFSVLNETVFNVSLPDIAAQFGIEPSVANYINTSFILSFAVGTAVYGKISDIYGIKKLFFISVLIYGGGSLIGLLFHFWFPALLAARFIQGAGASAVPGLIMVIVTRSIEKQHQGKAFGMIGSTVALGEGFGPVLGGWIADYIHWSYLFFLPMMTLVTLPFFLRTLPDEPVKKGGLDVPGCLLFVLGIASFTLFTTHYEWWYLIISVILFIGFVLRIRGAKEPFLEPALFKRKRFIVGVLVGGILLGTVAGFMSMIPYMMREVHQMSTSLIGGSVLFPGTIGVIFFGIVGGSLVDRRGARFVMIAGLLLLGAGLLIVSLFADSTPWIISGALVLIFGGLSFVKTVISTIVAGSLSADESGSGMGFLNFSCFLAEGLGIAIVGGLLTQLRLNFPILPMVTDVAAYLYSNLTLLLLAAVIIGGAIFLIAFREGKASLDK